MLSLTLTLSSKNRKIKNEKENKKKLSLLSVILTKIVSNLEDDRSFLMKSIELEFYSCLEIGSCLRDL